MTFFAEAEPPAEAPREPYVRPPAWAGPPDDEVPVLVPMTRFLAREPEAVLVLTSAEVYSTGVTLGAKWMLRRGARQSATDWAAMRDAAMNHHSFGGGSGGGRQLRFGVQFPDGRSARTTDASAEPASTERPLLQLRGGGSGGSLERLTGSTELWLYPVPPAGDLRLVVDWPAVGIAESSVTLDGTLIASAAGRAERVWPGAD